MEGHHSTHGNHASGHPFAFLGSLEQFLDEYLIHKAPFTLPVGAREFLVKAAPYLVIIFLVMSLPAILMLLGMGSWLGGMVPQTMGMMAGFSAMMLVYGILAAAVFVMEAVAVPGLFARTKKGRNWLYYAQVLSFVVSLLSGSVLGAIIGAAIGLYILFQIKSYYK